MNNRQFNTDSHITHPHIDTRQTHEDNYESHQLNTYNDKSYCTKKKTNEQPLFNEFFNIYEFNNGLSMHISDATEQKNTTNTLEIMPCVNINIMIIGSLSYAINGEKSSLTASNDSAGCSALIFQKKEIITRHLKKGEKIKKISLYLDHEWLKHRCTYNDEYNIFSLKKKQKHQWQATQEQIDIAIEIFQMECSTHQHSLRNNIIREYKTIHLASLLLNSFLNISTYKTNNVYSSSYTTNKKTIDFIERIKKTSLDINNKISLNALAEAHNISVSTLQRRFKAYCGITVKEYIRTSRLELAKKAIAIDGKSIGEAAYIAGYNHSSNFITAFKKQFNITPKKLIELYRK